jgi:predicted nucleic acid-binding protein
LNDVVIDASLALQWFLEDEQDRNLSLFALERLIESSAVVPSLFFYEVGNGLLMAVRRKRITFDQTQAFLERLRELPIRVDGIESLALLNLPKLANAQGLTNYDAAYLDVAMRREIPIATSDSAIQAAAQRLGVALLTLP